GGELPVFADCSAGPGLSGMDVGTKGSRHKSHGGKHRSLKARPVPLADPPGPKYATHGFTTSTNPTALKRPALEVGKTAPRSAILVLPGRGFLSSIGCFNPSKGLANAAADIDFADSRSRVIALINDLHAFLGESFPAVNNKEIPAASIIIEGEPSA